MRLAEVERPGLKAQAIFVLLRRLLYGVFVVALGVLLGALSLVAVPRLLGYGTLIVQGGSMGESIPIGSLVFTQSLPAENVQLGDVILVREQTQSGGAVPKLHRVISLERRDGQVVVWTKGDANDTPDPLPYVLPGEVLTPAYHLQYLGYFVGFIATPIGWLILVVFPGMVLCITTLRGIWASGPGRRDSAGTAPSLSTGDG
jgi:signal peptidase I